WDLPPSAARAGCPARAVLRVDAVGAGGTWRGVAGDLGLHGGLDLGHVGGGLELAGAQDVHDQDAGVGDHGTAGFGDDERVGDLGVVADALDAVHDVRGVLGDGVVDGRGPGGLGAVVVHAHAAADVDGAQTGAQADHLGVDVGQLVDGVLQDADVVELAADV